MFEVLARVDLVSLLLGAVIGALVSTWHGYFVTRPKLTITGSGGGGGPGPGFHANHIQISNSPALLGLRVPETILFGWRLHASFELGLVIDRRPAHECRAYIYDKETMQLICPLVWRVGATFAHHSDLDSGQSAQLMLFARDASQTSKYHIFQPDNPGADKPKLPSEELLFQDTRSFLVEVQHSYGKRKIRFEVGMTKGFDGRLSYHTKSGGGSF